MAQSLDESERTRAARFVFAEDREDFVRAHGILRGILSRYVGRAPPDIGLRVGAQGKPSLMRSPDEADIRFSMAHSGGSALYAVARGCEVGVDIERARPGMDFTGVSERFFSPRERAALDAVANGQRREAFLNLWTCKEAVAKATGLGLSLPLERLEIVFPAGAAGAWTELQVNLGRSGCWFVRNLGGFGPGWAAAVATQSAGCAVTVRHWTPAVERGDIPLFPSPIPALPNTKSGKR